MVQGGGTNWQNMLLEILMHHESDVKFIFGKIMPSIAGYTIRLSFFPLLS
jgi:hypothetical protein